MSAALFEALNTTTLDGQITYTTPCLKESLDVPHSVNCFAGGALLFMVAPLAIKHRIERAQRNNARLSSAAETLAAENAELVKQRDYARDELAKYRAQAEGLSSQLKNFNNKAASIGGFRQGTDGALSLDQDFAFNTGSAKVNDAGRDSIRQLAELLNTSEYAGTIVIIEGHTDSTPVNNNTKKQFIDNWGLSAMRSAAVIRELQEAGIDAKRLQGAFRGQFLRSLTTRAKKANQLTVASTFS